MNKLEQTTQELPEAGYTIGKLKQPLRKSLNKLNSPIRNVEQITKRLSVFYYGK